MFNNFVMASSAATEVNSFNEALGQLQAQAAQMGANAVLGIKWSSGDPFHAAGIFFILPFFQKF